MVDCVYAWQTEDGWSVAAYLPSGESLERHECKSARGAFHRAMKLLAAHRLKELRLGGRAPLRMSDVAEWFLGLYDEEDAAEPETRMRLDVQLYGTGWELTTIGSDDEIVGIPACMATEKEAFREAVRKYASGEVDSIETPECGVLSAKGLAEWFLRLYDED